MQMAHMCGIRPIACDVTFRILPYGGRHCGGQKCIAVIERKVLIVSLFANASGMTTCTPTRHACLRYKHIKLYLYKSCWSSHLCWLRVMQLAPFSQSPQYISELQNGGHHTEVFGRVWNVTSHAMGLQYCKSRSMCHLSHICRTLVPEIYVCPYMLNVFQYY